MTFEMKVLNRKEVSVLISQLKADILREWEAQSREKVAAAKLQSRLALRDSLPEFLDQLVLTLECSNPKEQAATNAEVAREHGEDRSKQPEYTLEEVIFEYHILRSVIIEHLEASGSTDTNSRKIIHEFIDRGIGKAAATYAEIEISRQAVQKRDFEEAKIEAERSNQAKSAFLANMSHEIRTPLGAIMGFVGLLKDKGLSDDEILKYHAIIDRNSNHLLRIIDDILDLAKVEAGKVVIEKIEFSLLEFLIEFSSLAAIKAREKGIAFEFRPETLVPELVISDPTRLRQVLSNIVGNAIKFTEKGSVEFRVKYNNERLQFIVTDTGRGIAPEQRTALFQAFSQADSSTTRKFGGTGLGLVLTKKIAQAFGGDFDLMESEIGKGSIFEASIPVTVPAKAKLVSVDKVEVEPTSDNHFDPFQVDLKGLEILLVEDSPDNQYLIQKMLSKTGAKIVTANDGAEGVKLALAHRYDIILMDIQMPVMDGHQAVRTLRSQGYARPIVALTAHAMKEEREHAVLSGFSHFLTKPINRKSLIDLLQMLHSPHNLGL
jgi:signal transduction histidine kinase